jgi:predicted kinase
VKTKNMKKITVTVGVSGSGKSSWAHLAFKMDPKNVRIVNRDKLRELLFGYTEESVVDYYLRPDINRCEKEITRYEDNLIHDFLADNKHVIVDATHLHKSYITRYKYWNVPVEVKIFKCTVKEALTNNAKRIRKVSDKIILKQYNKFSSLVSELNANPIKFETEKIELNREYPKCVIFDIDGTLAHKGSRNPFNWASVGRDKIDSSTADMFRYLQDYQDAISKLGNEAYNFEEPPSIIICTGRDAICLKETEKWLEKHNLFADDIYIREHNDNRADWIVKEEFWRQIALKYNIVGMFDDRLQVVRRARALGLKVFNVEHNNF